MTPTQRLAELGIALPEASTPAGLYRSGVQVGSLLFLSGVGPKRADGSFVTGKVGDTVSLDEARHGARLAGIQLLAARETRTDGRYRQSFEVRRMATLDVERQADRPGNLSSFARWQSPAWKAMTVAIR